MALVLDSLLFYHMRPRHACPKQGTCPYGLPVWTNMESLTFGRHIEIDDLLTFRRDIYGGKVILDEGHTVLDPRQTRSAISAFMTYWIVQAGKRQLAVDYSSHLEGMVMPAVRNLTGTVVRCQTPRVGGAVWFDSFNQQKLVKALAWKQDPPKEKRSYLPAHMVRELRRLYDPGEVIDPFAYYRSQFNTSRAAKKILEAQDGAETAIAPSNGLMRGRKSAAAIQDERMELLERQLARFVDQNERIIAGDIPYNPPPHGPTKTFGIEEDEG